MDLNPLTATKSVLEPSNPRAQGDGEGVKGKEENKY